MPEQPPAHTIYGVYTYDGAHTYLEESFTNEEDAKQFIEDYPGLEGFIEPIEVDKHRRSEWIQKGNKLYLARVDTLIGDFYIEVQVVTRPDSPLDDADCANRTRFEWDGSDYTLVCFFWATTESDAMEKATVRANLYKAVWPTTFEGQTYFVGKLDVL